MYSLALPQYWLSGDARGINLGGIITGSGYKSPWRAMRWGKNADGSRKTGDDILTLSGSISDDSYGFGINWNDIIVGKSKTSS